MGGGVIDKIIEKNVTKILVTWLSRTPWEGGALSNFQNFLFKTFKMPVKLFGLC